MIYSFHIHLFIGFMQIDTALFRRGSFLWGVVVLTAVLFASCNDDVFVENITPEVTKLQMPADGSTRSIGFQSGDWELWGMSFVNNPLYFDLLRGNIYDLQGQLLAADTVLCGGGWWKWELEHSTLALTVERPSAKELRVTAEENITSSPVSLNLFVGNERDTYTICLDIAPTAEPYRPTCLHNFSLYLDGKWYSLTAHPDTYDDTDPIGVLDVTVSSRLILDEILGIKDLRTDKRIDFVGGIRGLGELKKRVDSGEMKMALALYPVSMKQLMDIADSGNIMPPKTTWFEPKLRSGLVIHKLS